MSGLFFCKTIPPYHGTNAPLQKFILVNRNGSRVKYSRILIENHCIVILTFKVCPRPNH